ncbi:MAG: hypothetical protein ACXWO1_12680 [Isosphaeraceae bacterium]
MRLQAGSPKGQLPKDLRETAPAVTHHLPTDTCKTDPGLAAVVAAWPELPEAIRAGIVAMVKAALGKGHRVTTIARPSIPSQEPSPQTEPPFPWRRVPVRNTQG